MSAVTEEQKIALDDIVPEYRSNLIFIKRLFWERLYSAIDTADLRDNLNILDIGTGAGNLLKIIQDKYNSVYLYGIDYNINLSGIKLNNTIKVYRADARQLPFRDTFFDVVFALDILEHIPEVEVAVKEVKRVLKSNGLFIVSAPTENILHKIGRIVLRGKISRREGQGSGRHYYNAMQLKKIIEGHMPLISQRHLPGYSPFPILKVFKFKKTIN